MEIKVTEREFRQILRIRRRLGWLLEHPRFREVEDMLASGYSVSEIAYRILEWDDVNKPYQAIKSDISYLKRNYPKLRKFDIMKYVEDVKRAEMEINELNELIRLYKLQMDRISIDYNLEKNILKKLMPTMSNEIKTALEILKAIAVLKDKLTGAYSFPEVEQEVAEAGRKPLPLPEPVRNLSQKSLKNVLDFIEKALKINEANKNETDTEDG